MNAIVGNMLQTVKRRCRCGLLVESGKRCRCQRPKNRLYDRRAWRGSDSDPNSGLRGRYLAEHPLCEQCSTPEHPVPAVDVDHIQPHNDDPNLAWDWNNLRALCKACHGRKTRRQR